MHLESWESTRETREVRGEQTLLSCMLSQLPACIHNSAIGAQPSMDHFQICLGSEPSLQCSRLISFGSRGEGNKAAALEAFPSRAIIFLRPPHAEMAHCHASLNIQAVIFKYNYLWHIKVIYV